MTYKLTYEQWKEKHNITVSENVRKAIKDLHDLDADQEVEQVLLKEYEFYLEHFGVEE